VAWQAQSARQRLPLGRAAAPCVQGFSLRKFARDDAAAKNLLAFSRLGV